MLSETAGGEHAANAEKMRAAEWAALQIEDGMAVGLGSGSTSALVIEAVGRRVAAGLRIAAIATSQVSQRLAADVAIPMTDFSHVSRLDLTIDGADEVELETLNLIKGHGGALLREKLVAMASGRLLIAVDSGKPVKVLGSVFQVPVEVVPFGWETTAGRLRDRGFAPELRLDKVGRPYLTDGKHYILHCSLAQSGLSAQEAADSFKSTTGVVEHGLFLGLASEVVVGTSDGVKVLERAH